MATDLAAAVRAPAAAALGGACGKGVGQQPAGCLQFTSSLVARALCSGYSHLGRRIARRPRLSLALAALVYAACVPGLFLLTGSSRIVFLPVETSFMTQFVYQTSRFIRDYRRGETFFQAERVSALLFTPVGDQGLASPDFLRFAVATERRIASLTGDGPGESFADLCVRRALASGAGEAAPCEIRSIFRLLLGDDLARANATLDAALATTAAVGAGADAALAARLIEAVPLELRPAMPLLIGQGAAASWPGANASTAQLGAWLAGARAAQVVLKLRAVPESSALERRIEQFVERERSRPGGSPGRVSAFLASSLDEEVAQVAASALPLIGATVVLMLGYSMVFLVSQTRWPGRCQVFLILFGSSIPGLSSIAAFGLMGYLGRPANSLTILTPFVGLATGIDALFVMTSAFREVGSGVDCETAMASALSKGGFAITVTTATSVVACLVAALTAVGMPGFVSLHLTLATTVFMNWLGFMTLYPATMALNDKWIAANYAKRREQDEADAEAGAEARAGVVKAPSLRARCFRLDVASAIRHLIGEAYAPLLAGSLLMQTAGVAVMLGLVAAGLSLAPSIAGGMPDRHFVTDSSYLNDFFDDLVLSYGSKAPVEIGLVIESPQLGQAEYRAELLEFLDVLEGRDDIRFVDCWPGRVARALPTDVEMSATAVASFLETLLETPMGAAYRTDARVSESRSVEAARCRVVAMQSLDGDERARQAVQLSRLPDNYGIDAMIFHSSWPTFVDIHIKCKAMTHATMRWALLSVFGVLVLLMPLHLALMTGFCVSSVIFVLFGFMRLTGLTYNGVTYTISVVAIGFSVDYSCHICHFCASGVPPDTPWRERVRLSLQACGYDVFHGCLTACLGVLSLGLHGSESFRIFSRMVMVVTVTGGLFAVWCLPSALVLLARLSAVLGDEALKALGAAGALGAAATVESPAERLDVEAEGSKHSPSPCPTQTPSSNFNDEASERSY